MESAPTQIEQYEGFKINPSIEVRIPSDKTPEYYENDLDTIKEVRRVGSELVAQGIDIIVREYNEGGRDINSAIQSLNVLSSPSIGNLLPERTDLPFNKGEYRKSMIGIIEGSNPIVDEKVDYIPVPFSLPKDIQALLSTMNEVITSLSYQVRNEDDLDLLATYAKICFVRIHPYEDGNGRTSRAFYSFIRKMVGDQNDIPFIDNKFPDRINRELKDTSGVKFQDSEVFGELGLNDQMFDKYRVGFGKAYNDTMRSPMIRGIRSNGISIGEDFGNRAFTAIEKGLRKPLILDELRKLSPKLVELANPNTRLKINTPQT